MSYAKSLLVPWLAVLWTASGACAHVTANERLQRARRSQAGRAALQASLEARLKESPKFGHVGVYVAGLADGQVLLAHRAEEPFVPASTAKVLTAAAALDALGPQYRFDTQLWADGVNERQHSVRNVYLRGTGDPSFAAADLADFVATLRQQGLRTITGELVIDDGAFDATPWARGWMWDDLSSGFSAPVSALNVAGNALSLRFKPGRRGERPSMTYHPATRYVSLANEAITVAAGQPHGLRLGDGTDAAALDGPPEPAEGVGGGPGAGRPLADVALAVGQKVVAGGSLSESTSGESRVLAVKHAATWASVLFKEQLQAAGIAPPPTWRRGTVPPLATLIASHSSAELSSLLFEALKTSNNHTMECVLKRMGADATLQPGTFASGAQVVRRHAADKVGLQAGQEPLLWDGSGLSRYNLVTPRVLGEVVRRSAGDFRAGAELSAGLPIAGLDGTLAHRQRGALRGRVRAKTGTMTGVSALTGLLQTQDGDTLAFAIMLDHYVATSEQARQLQDDLLALLDRPPEP